MSRPLIILNAPGEAITDLVEVIGGGSIEVARGCEALDDPPEEFRFVATSEGASVQIKPTNGAEGLIMSRAMGLELAHTLQRLCAGASEEPWRYYRLRQGLVTGELFLVDGADG